MIDYEKDIAELEQMIEEVQRIRNRTCEPLGNGNPRYLALSNAVTGMRKAVKDMGEEG